MKEKNSSANTARSGNNISLDNNLANEIFSSQIRALSPGKKPKKMNKMKTSMEPLFNGSSLILLKKIEDENKQLAKQLKDFNSKNFQLELSIKGINVGGVCKIGNSNSIKKRNSNTSKLSSFTNRTRNELKNIEKKYGLSKK